MDNIKKYQKAILDFLSTYAKEVYSDDPSGMVTQIIADKTNHHYLLLRLGWANQKHIHFCPFQFDIKNNKIWIQVNNTETMVADELMNRGIEKSDIVLAFHREDMRQFTGFSVA